jgi:hypothetical protein
MDSVSQAASSSLAKGPGPQSWPAAASATMDGVPAVCRPWSGCLRAIKVLACAGCGRAGWWP